MPQGSNPIEVPLSSPSDLANEFKYLTEDQKIVKIMEMMKNIYFGELVIKKHKGKIAAFDFKGQVLFRLEEFDKAKAAKAAKL